MAIEPVEVEVTVPLYAKIGEEYLHVGDLTLPVRISVTEGA